MNKTRLIVLDVETYRTRDEAIIERISQEVLEKRPAQNTAKEVKLEWDTSAARDKRVAEALAKTSVDVLLAELLCVGYEYGDAGLCPWLPKAEAIMLAQTAMYWSDLAGPETVWVGHNVIGFDLPVLLNSFRRYRVRPPEHFPRFVNGRWQGRIFDLMLRTPCKNGLGFVSIDEVCAAYRVPTEKPPVMWRDRVVDGSMIGEMYEAGEYELIQAHCCEDLAKSRALYHVMTGGDTWGTYDSHSEVAEQVTEIERSDDLSDGARALALVNVLDRAGLIPRAA